MSASISSRPTTLVLCALAALWLSAGAGAAAPGKPPWTERLAQRALSSGFLTRLPPTVSVALGLVKGSEGTDVRQLIRKSGHQVHTFNVSVARHSDLVVFEVDARTGATVAYLVGADAQLRKAVSYQAGQEAVGMAEAEARAGLAREAQFWTGRAPAAPPATPAAPSPPAAPGARTPPAAAPAQSAAPTPPPPPPAAQ